MFWTNAAISVLLIFYVVVCVLMGLAIMMQRSKQEGLGTAFGGAVTSEIFGAGASAFLVKATVWLAAIFFLLSISLARLYSHRAALAGEASAVQQELMKSVAPAAPLAPPGIMTNSMAQPVAPSSTQVVPAPVIPPPATNGPATAAPGKPATK
jgi:preprotein translocase subunit SecG